MKLDKLNIGLIIGGKSVEHDISILSGLQAYHAIDKEKYNVIILYIDKFLNIYQGDLLKEIDTYKNEAYKKLKQVCLYSHDNKVYYTEINKRKPLGVIDVFLPVVHGDGIEDGTLSGYLDMLGATHTLSDVTSSSIAQDKIYTKLILEKENINVINYLGITFDRYSDTLEEEITTKLKFPLIIKPARLGSSIGIKTVYDKNSLHEALLEVNKYGSRILIEEKLENFKEYNMAIIKEGSKIITSSIEEVIKTDEILSFKDKYENNQKYSESNRRIIPAQIPYTLESNIRNMVIKAYNALNMNGVVRIDTLYDTKNDILYLNEINTVPGSLSFYLFDIGSITFTKLIDILIKNAIISKNKNKAYLKIFDSNILDNKTLKLHK